LIFIYGAAADDKLALLQQVVEVLATAEVIDDGRFASISILRCFFAQRGNYHSFYFARLVYFVQQS